MKDGTSHIAKVENKHTSTIRINVKGPNDQVKRKHGQDGETQLYGV